MSILQKVKKLNLRSIILNFYILPFNQAIKLPILFSNRVVIKGLKRNSFIIKSKIKTGMIQIGYKNVGVLDLKYERSIVEIVESGKIIFHKNCFLGSGIRLSVKGILCFGDNVCINGNSKICCWKKITFGNNILVSWNCLIMDTDFHKISLNNIILNNDKDIEISDNCWIGVKTTILKGSFIPMNSVIGACSLINKKLEKNNCIYAGNPAKILKENILWEK